MKVLFIFEIIGTITFAISGAVLAIRKELDFFGIIFLSVTTAIGGGIIRDVLIGNTPPAAFVHPVYIVISIASAMLTIIFYRMLHKLNNILLIFDAVGLSVFTAVGARIALDNGITYPFAVIFVGTMTGVGGGIARDMFVNNIPLVFCKEIYAISSIAGATIFFYLTSIFDITLSSYICFFVVFVIRLVSIRLNINLPVVRNDS